MPKARARVLLDTNILISGLVLLKGNEHKILKLAEEEEIVLILPESVLEEARMVLARSFPGHESLLDTYLSKVKHTLLPWKDFGQSVRAYIEKVRDRKDAPLLASVVVAKPDFTLIGDATLREDLKRCGETDKITKICSSTQFLRAMSKTSVLK
jgi:putative PIN family toxin of toxin-antitoxin system